MCGKREKATLTSKRILYLGLDAIDFNADHVRSLRVYVTYFSAILSAEA